MRFPNACTAAAWMSGVRRATSTKSARGNSRRSRASPAKPKSVLPISSMAAKRRGRDMPAATELRAERRVDLMVKSATTAGGSLLASYRALISAGVSLEVSGIKLRNGCASGCVAVSFTPFFFAPRISPLRKAARSQTEMWKGSLRSSGWAICVPRFQK